MIKYDDSALKSIRECGKKLSMLVRSFYACSRQVLGQNSELPAAQIRDLLNAAVDQIYEANDVGIDVVATDINDTLKLLNDLNKALQDGDWDSNENNDISTAPVWLRAEIFKSEIKEAEMMKYKLENKDLDIKELKKTLKLKSDEMSELQVIDFKTLSPTSIGVLLFEQLFHCHLSIRF